MQDRSIGDGFIDRIAECDDFNETEKIVLMFAIQSIDWRKFSSLMIQSHAPFMAAKLAQRWAQEHGHG